MLGSERKSVFKSEIGLVSSSENSQRSLGLYLHLLRQLHQPWNQRVERVASIFHKHRSNSGVIFLKIEEAIPFMKYAREDIQAVIVATIAVSVVCAFMYPLSESPTFFDGFGRITLIYIVGAAVIATLMAPRSRSFRNICQGALAVAFFGAIGGLILEGIFRFVRS